MSIIFALLLLRSKIIGSRFQVSRLFRRVSRNEESHFPRAMDRFNTDYPPDAILSLSFSFRSFRSILRQVFRHGSAATSSIGVTSERSFSR